MHRMLKLGFAAVLLMMFAAPSHASRAADTAPLLLNTKGDLWSWTSSNGLKQLTHYGYNSGVILSPDGSHVAYLSVPQGEVTTIKAEGGHSGASPENIWVLNPTTGDAIRIAEQPTDAAYSLNGPRQKWIERSDPTWSPDSKQVAWIERTYDSSTPNTAPERLMSITPGDKTPATVLLDNIPLPVGEGALLAPYWGGGGIAFLNYLSKDGQPGAQMNVLSPTGKLTQVQTADGLGNLTWVLQGDQPMKVAVTKLMSSGGTPATASWELFDLDRGAFSPLNGTLEMYSIADVATVTGTGNGRWTIHLNGSETKIGGVDPASLDVTEIAISPDGTQVAYVDSTNGAVYVYANGAATQIADQASALAWSAQIWRVKGL